MRPNRIFRLGLVLLFALMLPLQGFAAMPGCGRPDHAVQPLGHTAAHHCTREPAATHHSGCGDCCCAIAMVLAPIDWTALRLAAPEISDTLIWSAPAVALDRLDRPPRFTAV